MNECEEVNKATKTIPTTFTGGPDKSSACPTSRCILCDGQNTAFDTSLVIYINRTNIPPIMITNRIKSFPVTSLD